MKNKIIYFILIVSVIYIKCASRGAPGGGPVDRTPPQIIEIYPPRDSTGIKFLSQINFIFSERMEESSVERSIFISPPVEYETDWSRGRKLSLELKDTLIADQTYVITIGAGAKDMRNNRMDESFQLAFASGEQLNQGRVDGQIFGLNKLENYYLFAYDTAKNDSIDPRYTKANLLTQPGSKGEFSFNYLADGNYRIFVIEDVNKNLLLDAAYERLGIPEKDVQIDSLNQQVQNLNFRISRIDTTAPLASTVRAINNKTILVRLSEPVLNIDQETVVIRDTLNGNVLAKYGQVFNEKEKNQLMIYTAEQDSAHAYQVKLWGLTDSSGNAQKDTFMLKFNGSDFEDTTAFDIDKIIPVDSIPNFNILEKIEISFSIPVDTASVRMNTFLIKLPEDTIVTQWHWNAFRSAQISAGDVLFPDTQFHLILNLSDMRSVWGDSLKDSLITHYFITENTDNYGELSGEILNTGPSDKSIFIYAKEAGGRKAAFPAKVDSLYKFDFDYLPDGLYILEAYKDKNGDHKYSNGSILPFNFAEPFRVGTDTIRVRKRWEKSGIQFDFKYD